MGDTGELWKAFREAQERAKARYGKPCPSCVRLLPKADPKILMPGSACTRRGHRYFDKRPDLTAAQWAGLS